MNAELDDDELVRFHAHGSAPLPAADAEGWLDHDGARIWHASFGRGPAASATAATGATRCRHCSRPATARS